MPISAITTALALPAAGAAWYLAPMLARRVKERRLRKYCATTGTLVLSYDDGPGVESTPELLKLLGSRGARATFFLTGSRAAAHPELVDRIVEEGHEIGCHGYDHLNAWRISPRRAGEDMDQAYRALSRWIPDHGPYRPPCGKLTLGTWAALRHRKASIGWWTVVGGDVEDDLPDSEAAVEQVKRAGGGIVLLHDFDREKQRSDFVLKSTALLLDAAEQKGWVIRTLGELEKTGKKHAA